MSDRQNSVAVLKPYELAGAGALVGTMVIIWAASGLGYFWPIWVAIGLSFPLGIRSSIRWAKQRPIAALDQGLTAVAGVCAVVSCLLIVIWLVTGAGYFWPIWTIVGTALFVGLFWLLRRPDQHRLEVRVDELQRTRSGALDVQATELRRIERDLHDGAQARLVALSMKLGRAEERFADQHPETAEVLRDARREAAAAIAELRELARGIAPPVLADRGLEAAVRSLADRSGTEVTVQAELTRRPVPAVETAAYFVVAESLTNAAKHAPGATVEVTLSEVGSELVLEVTDLGPGGAVPTGSGLTGLRQRVEALDGQLSIISPPGVGTRVEAVLPCGW